MHFQAFIRAVLRSCDLRLSDFCINETIRTSICGTDRSFYRCDVINSDHWRLYWMLGRGLIDLYGRLKQAIIFIIMFVVVQQFEGNVIYPHVVGNSVGLPAIWVLVAVTIGGNIAGIVGMIFSIPFCSVLYQLFSEIVNKQIKKKNVDIP